jgi:two-component system, chemotaxis family, CheB/CheR fusion protein
MDSDADKDGSPPADVTVAPATLSPRQHDGSFPVVGVGASAGGLEAFLELLKHLPLDTGMAFVLVQHLDPQHDSVLTQILARGTKLPVHEVIQDVRVAPNTIYVISPNTNLAISDGLLTIVPRSV